MRKRLAGILRLSTAGLVLCGFLALTATPAYGAETTLLGVLLLCLAPLGERLDTAYGRAYRYLMNGITILAALVLAFALVQRVLVIDVETWLVLYIQAHKLFHRKTPRDYYQIFLMSFFMVISGCAQDPEAWVGLVLLAYMLCAVWAFMLLQLFKEADIFADYAMADIVPLRGAGSSALTGLSKRPALGITVPAVALSGGCIVLAAGLFLFTPRMEAGLFGRGNLLPIQRTGLSNSVDLTEGGLIEPDPSPVMHVEFPDEPGQRYEGPLYWRCTSMDDYAKAVWSEWEGLPGGIRDRAPIVELLRSSRTSLDRTPSGRGRIVKQVVYLDKVNTSGLPCLPWLQRIACKGAFIEWDLRRDCTVEVTASRTPSLQYEALSEVDAPAPEMLRACPQDYAGAFAPQDYRRLTAHDLEPRSLDLARQLTASASNTYDKVMALKHWLEGESFAYSLNIPRLPPEHAMDAFIHDVRRGHCELFGSALALMVRSLGIPARVVSGYRGGEWSAADGAYIVRSSMAHLWVEVYFLDYGWVLFDPSPEVDETGGSLNALARLISRQILNAKMVWYRDIVGYDGGLRWEQLRNLSLGLIGLDGELFARGLRTARFGSARMPWRVLVFGAMAFALFSAVALLRSRERRAGPRALPVVVLTPDQVRARRLFRFLKRRLRRIGVPDPGLTAREALAAATAAPGVPTEAVERLLGVYEHARFGYRPLSPAEFRICLRQVRRLTRSALSDEA